MLSFQRKHQFYMRIIVFTILFFVTLFLYTQNTQDDSHNKTCSHNDKKRLQKEEKNDELNFKGRNS